MARIVDLDGAGVDAACAALFDAATRDRKPDLLIAIPTGGLHVARAMIPCAGAIPIFPLTCRRPSTSRKQGAAKLVSRLPRPLVDGLRRAEHAVLTAMPRKPAPREFDADELDALRRWFADVAKPPFVLVVDDAVDTGATLMAVVDTVKGLAPQAIIRTAAITVTTAQPLLMPDYSLYRGQLCRFPWSLDSRRNRPSTYSTSMAQS